MTEMMYIYIGFIAIASIGLIALSRGFLYYEKPREDQGRIKIKPIDAKHDEQVSPDEQKQYDEPFIGPSIVARVYQELRPTLLHVITALSFLLILGILSYGINLFRSFAPALEREISIIQMLNQVFMLSIFTLYMATTFLSAIHSIFRLNQRAMRRVILQWRKIWKDK